MSSSPEVKSSRKYRQRRRSRSRSSSYEQRRHRRRSMDREYDRPRSKKKQESKRRDSGESRKRKEKVDLKAETQKALLAAANSEKPANNNNNDIATTTTTTILEQQQRVNKIEEIENEPFAQMPFQSSKSEIPLPQDKNVDSAHQSAMFKAISNKNNNTNINNSNNNNNNNKVYLNKKNINNNYYVSFPYDVNNPLSIIHPSLLGPADEKLERWLEKMDRLKGKYLKPKFTS